MMRRPLALLAVAVVVSACGGGGQKTAGRPSLTVFAASSLRSAFADYGSTFKSARVRLSLGGSDELAAQIRGGSPADVFAAANTKLPQQLYAAGKLEKPVVFTANRLVLAVPSGSTKVKSLSDLTRSGVSIAIGAPAVPVGSYTRKMLGALPALERNRILANVKTEEPDVAGIVGKLNQRAVAAGFVYVTDVQATHGQLHALTLYGLPAIAKYAAAVVRGTKHPAAARAFLHGLASGAGQRDLRRAGFMALP